MITLTKEALDTINTLVNKRAWLISLRDTLEPGQTLLLKREAYVKRTVEKKVDGKGVEKDVDVFTNIAGTHAYLEPTTEQEVLVLQAVLQARIDEINKKLADAVGVEIA